MMKKTVLIAGLLMALSGSVFANEEGEDAKLALIQECTQSADEAGLEGDERDAFIANCSKAQEGKSTSEEG